MKSLLLLSIAAVAFVAIVSFVVPAQAGEQHGVVCPADCSASRAGRVL